MLFSSITFLLYFLTITLAVYFIIPIPNGSPRFRNYWLLAASLVFYGWGEPKLIIVMIAQTLAAWSLGLLINRWRGTKKGTAAFVISIVIGLGSLAFYKYADFFISNINALSGADIPLFRLVMPVGISFYTFQIISYTIDLKHGNIEVQRNYFTLATYTALFPQLVAGPIVRYADVQKEFTARTHSLGNFARGARRFTFGLAKKVLIANTLASLVSVLRAGGERSALAAWVYLISYTLQIYFDFSGYSDMALGLGTILGFNFPENFDYPYTASSITEFWRRWHMSLSTWFRDYVYFPLGGSRVRAARHIFNLLAVWALTGFWHGADWNFMLWGVYYAVILIAEKFLLKGILPKLPGVVLHIYTLLLVMIGWVFFDAASLSAAFVTLGDLFGRSGAAGNASLYYLRSYALPLAFGVIGATRLPMRAAQWVREHKPAVNLVIEPLSVLALLAVIAAFLIDGSFNPFIYFRF